MPAPGVTVAAFLDRGRAAPVAETERVHAMDVIRGVALLGILIVNMDFFGSCFSSLFGGGGVEEIPVADRLSWWAVQTLFEGKFISIFSFLFGAGIALQAMRSDRIRSTTATTVMLLRRLAFLALVGFLHGTLVWYGDILFAYATMGWVLIPLRFLQTRAIGVLAFMLFLLAMGCAASLNAPAAPPPADQASPVVERRTEPPEIPDGPTSLALLRSMGEATRWNVLDERWAPFERAAYRHGPWSVATLFRALQWSQTVPLVYLSWGAHLLGMFFLGTAVARAGLLRPAYAMLHRRVALVAVPLGILCSAVIPTLLVRGAGRGDPMVAGFASVHELGMTLLAIGYVGALTGLAHAGPRWLVAFLGRAGRVAFTIYLSMSVLMTCLFYWWGFGFFDTIGETNRVAIAVVTWLCLASLAQIWLRSFTMGPLEWIWRSVTYLECPAIRRSAVEGSVSP